MSSKSSCLFTLSLVSLFLCTVFSQNALPITNSIQNALLDSTQLLQRFMPPEKLDGFMINNEFDKFIQNLGILNETLIHPDTDANSNPMHNEVLYFGDILIDETPEDKKEKNTGDVANDFISGVMPVGQKKKSEKKLQKPKKWPNGVIPYYISKAFNAKDKKKILKGLKEMNSKARNVHFRPYRESDENYVMIINGNGCYSHVGMRGGQQATSLQSDKCLGLGTVEHEMMHVLGFNHEQNRPDRNRYIKILYKNIPKNYRKDYRRLSSEECVYIGYYDYYSVMQYPPEAPNDNGYITANKFAFKVLDKNINMKKVGLQKRMSKEDIKKIDEHYSNKQ